MTLPANILYPVDFSDRSHAVWPAVAGMARQLGAAVTLLHAFDTRALDLAALSSDLATIRARVCEKLDQFPTPELEAGQVSREIAEGPAAACIVERAGMMNAPLIMMPTRGHTRFRQLLLGSVTSAVLHDAVCPVWTEAHTEYRSISNGVYGPIVCAIDMGPHSAGVLQFAAGFSKKLGALLRAVHSVPRIDPRFPSGTADRAHAFLVAQAREDFPAICRNAGTDVALEIVDETGLVDGILCAVARHHADLLIIGRGVIQGPLGRLRTNAHDLIRRSPCPVLSI